MPPCPLSRRDAKSEVKHNSTLDRVRQYEDQSKKSSEAKADDTAAVKLSRKVTLLLFAVLAVLT